MEETSGDKWGVELSESTADPSISMIAEDVPTLTLATIFGVTIVIVIAIVIVFVLGVLIDCRQKRMLDRQIEQMKRNKKHKRVNAQPLSDIVSIADNMEESAISPAPAEILQNIP